MNECSEYRIYYENDAWRVVCIDGSLQEISGLYETEEKAIEAIKSTGRPYKVVRLRGSYVIF